MAKESKKQELTRSDHQSSKETDEKIELIRILDKALGIVELARDSDKETTETAPMALAIVCFGHLPVRINLIAAL